MDLTKGPPRSPKSTATLNCVAVARMADKGRAHLAGKIGEYKFGSDYGMDRATLQFLGLTTGEFLEGLKACPDDASLTAWLQTRVKRTTQEIEAYNASRLAPPSTPEQIAFVDKRRAEWAPERTDLKTIFELTELNDRESFGLD